MDPKTGYPHPQPPPPYDSAQMGHHHQYMQHQPPAQLHVHPTMTVVPATTVIVNPQVGPNPTMVTCPSCRTSMVTRMEFEPSTKTHVMAAILCILGCFCCVCLPYCMDSCMNGNHYCTHCGAYIGTYSG